MNLTEIYAEVKKMSEDDQSILDTQIATWIDQAIERINIAMQSNIPKIKGQAASTIPSFDPRFHEALILFSVGKYHESDSAFNNAQYYMNEFNNMLATMQRDMSILPSTRQDYNVQQIIVSSSSVYVYPLAMPTGSYYDDVKVYKNDVEISAFTLDTVGRTIKISATIPLSVNDKITVVFENNSDLNTPPYSWWSF